jgi:hypothetical protein
MVRATHTSPTRANPYSVNQKHVTGSIRELARKPGCNAPPSRSPGSKKRREFTLFRQGCTFVHPREIAVPSLSLLECMAGTTGLEPATSAVTENQRQVTHWNQGERMAPFSALRNGWQPLLHPYRTHDLCPVNLCPGGAGIDLSPPALCLCGTAHQRILRP